MRSSCFLLLLLSTFLLHAQDPAPPLGQWRDHLPYHSIQDIEILENRIVAASPYSFFTYDPAESYIERFSKLSGLSETGIRLIYRLEDQNQLIVVYTNNNIDLLGNGRIRNVRDILQSNQVPEKGVYRVVQWGGLAYLSTAIGIVVLDPERAEVRETWRIGENGQDLPVYGLVRYNDTLYAATAQGIKSTPANTANPANFANWSLLPPAGPYAGASIQNIFVFGNQLICLQQNQFLKREGDSWSVFYEDPNRIRNHSVSGSRLSICQATVSGSRIVILEPDGQTQLVIENNNSIPLPQKMLWEGNTGWIADSIKGLVRYTGTQFESIIPSSPYTVAHGNIQSTETGILASAGAVLNGMGLNLPAGWFQLKEGNWENINLVSHPALAGVEDIHSIVANRTGDEIWAGTYDDGLLQWRQGQLSQTFTAGFLGEDLASPGSYKIGGLAFDEEERLWISNPGNSQFVRMRDSGNQWYAFSPPVTVATNQITDIVVDNTQQKWIAAGQTGLLAFSEGANINVDTDDRWRLLTFSSGSGNLPGNEVLAIEPDNNGEIWIGTNDGIAIIPCATDIFSNNACEAIRPIVRNGNFGGFLFQNERVLCIRTDGANRKWVGTENGAWLVSAQGDSILQHFTTSNSPLPANRVHSIAIVPGTGEVFFATSLGLVSYRGTATRPVTELASIDIFPNPVPPGYTGSIGIRGLKSNSLVKITELNGRLVYQAFSTGGQMVWNGLDYRGRKIATGVYLVLATDESGKEYASGKIVFVNR